MSLMLSKETYKKYQVLIISGIIFFFLVVWFIPPVWKLDEEGIRVQRWVRDRGEVMAEVGPGKQDWNDIETISRHVLYAILVAEDARFYDHGGLDWTEISRSIQTNWRKGRYVRGASTITQQVVKVAFLSRDKTLVRKAREAVGALLLEKLRTKQQIFEWYINLIEFGDGVYGIVQAAKYYFNTKPELLTIQQAAHLALVLPSPNRWSVSLKNRELTPFGHKRYTDIILKMYRANFITQPQLITALATGNFGGPVHRYDEIVSRFDQHQTDIPLDEEIDASLEEAPDLAPSALASPSPDAE